MAKFFRYALVAAAVLASSSAFAAFKDIRVDLTDGHLLTSDEIANQSITTFGVTIAADGTPTRVDKDDASANIVLTGKYHSNEHGWGNFSSTVAVDGPVKISMGTCAWGGDVTVKNEAGETVATFNTNNGTCFHGNKAENIASAYYKGLEPTTLTISGGSYTPYIAVEAADPSELIEEATITFSLGSVEALGVVPDAVKAEIGSKVAIPVNHTLYVEGKTLAGWTDGSMQYACGSEIEVPAGGVELTPVFADNVANLADRKEAVTVKWDFQRRNGAPLLNYQNKPGIYVAQAVVNGETIDVVTTFTTSPGKVNNGSWTDLCQMNGGTTWTIPSCANAVVSMEAYGEITTTTIDGQTDYTPGKTITYTVMNPAETIDVVIGDGSYYRYIQVELPYVAQSIGGTVYTDEPAEIYWPLDNPSDYATNYTIAPNKDAFDIVTVSINPEAKSISTEVGKDMDGQSTGVTFLKVNPSAGSSDQISWSVTPAKGLSFTPTKFSMHFCRFGTDAENGITITMTNEEGQKVTFGPYTALRNGKTVNKPYDANENATSYVEIELTPAQQEALATAGALTLSSTIGVGNAKQGGFAQVYIYGKLNGEAASVTKYTVDFAAAPEEGGNVSIYPVAEAYNEGSEVKLTAAENFGYDFVNWTDADGNVVSETPVFTYTVNANSVLTANFVAVETYELNYTVDGGANIYMVTPSPAPTVVDGKNMYEAGTNVSLVASSNPIVTFTNWSDGQTANEIIVTMNEDIDIVANYTAVDFIAGWDFYLPGGDGRPADFASADNDAAALVLRTDDGQTSGWLDKSQQGAGGYEGRPGAVNWRTGTVNGDVGNYYFQTMVNAEAFTDIMVKTASVYNYNSYKKYDLQYSLNGTDWTTVGSLEMSGAKSWTDLEVALPVAANNQKELYLRWYPDRNSDIDGTGSQNDGFCLGATYITGTAQLVDDGTAPVLVSTVPAEGAENASANGKIVLTFDEKVKVKAGATATLGQQTLEPKVAGKVVTFEYKGLSYTTNYKFTLPAGSVMDLTDNAINEAIVINFATKAKPEIAKAMYDFVVPDDGNFRDAINAANSRADKVSRFRIFVKQGAHVSPTQGEAAGTGDFEGNMYPDPRLDLTASNVSIIGEGLDNTSITNICPNVSTGANPIEGLRHAYTLHNTGTGTYIQDLKLINGMKDNTGRGEAYEESGDKTILKNVGLWGYQDTYCSNNGRGRYYFEGGIIRGCTDYICGKDDIFFNGVEFLNVGTGGYIAVPSSPKQHGWILRDCRVTAENAQETNGKFTLGRPWGSGTPIALWINTTFDVIPSAAGWNEMSGGWPARFAEYNSVTASGTPINLSGRKTTFGDGHVNNPILTAEEAAFYTIDNVLGGDDDWDPTELTEQASAPANVKIDSNTGVMSWDNSNYVLVWAICQNGKVVAFTTEPTFDTASLPATTAAKAAPVYSVRAANEMGGLGEAANATVTSVDIINGNLSEVVSSVYYNVAGATVDANYEGVVIRVDTLADGTTVTTKYVNK